LIPPKVSIIGAGRRRNGIGEHIGKYFHQQGANVTSVLGTTEATSLQASLDLRKYGIEARFYSNFNEMVKGEKPDAVVIASPSSTHYEYLLQCVNSGVHIFCEKPFIWDDQRDLRKRVEDIFEKAREKKLIIAMNSQWPFSLDAYETLCGRVVIQKLNTFFIKMSPPFAGRAMIPESVPHALSLLYCLLGVGEIDGLNFESDGKKEMRITFSYLFETQACNVIIKLIFQDIQPRELSFGLNDKIVSRSLGLEDYEIYFNYGDKRLRIIDPLSHSVQNFLEAVEKQTEPFIGVLHILHNMSLLKEIGDGYIEFEKRKPWKS
jgi:Oxidoreductase family, NAD-binding Rossmann fold